ncbi:hypothetical protein SAMN05444358_1011702 [Ruegeria halocynthiae]|uniref:Uncharacterized protein n=1 Tax=Ruegeria halocynthiae TaxID=985054 RepID=A0A1H2W860_9RHOB|nr:hypothetical protein [Ruegeria halocynthiae]SDW76646.1 hypothetical protein SAMN05444358_1011702 [Ruegeria halocynthiae]
MNGQQEARICVLGQRIKEAAELDMKVVANKGDLLALCDELNSLISEVA